MLANAVMVFLTRMLASVLFMVIHIERLPVTGKFMANDQNLAIILILHTAIIARVMMVGISHRATSSCRQAAAARSRGIGVRVFEAEGQTAGVEEGRSACFQRTRRCVEG